MVEQEVLDMLLTRVAFFPEEGFPLTVLAENITSASGASILEYHAMITLKNLYESVSKKSMTEDEFNAYLTSLRSETMSFVLSRILKEHRFYKPNKDYSAVISDRIELFDKAFGYSLATKCLGNFIASERKNSTVRDMNAHYQFLKIELWGVTSERGSIITEGLMHYREKAFTNAIRIIHPDPVKGVFKFW